VIVKCRCRCRCRCRNAGEEAVQQVQRCRCAVVCGAVVLCAINMQEVVKVH
jgi:hypothetical protein